MTARIFRLSLIAIGTVIAFAITVFLLLAILFLIQPGVDEINPKIIKGKQVGATLITALEKYRNEHQEFPTFFDQLVPHYIDKLPESLLGQPRATNFFYNRKAANSFVLQFSYERYSCVHDSDDFSQVWSCSPEGL